MRSLTGGREYRLDPPSIRWRGVWTSAHLVRSYYGVALVPDDELLPIEAVTWIEYTTDGRAT